MIIRRVEQRDHAQWLELRKGLWPDHDPAKLQRELISLFELTPPYTVFVAEIGDRLAGFIELWERSYAEGGPDEPAAYVEGIFVDSRYRRQGVGQAMLDAAEDWARGRGFPWLGSDATLSNELSRSWHLASGFGEVDRLIVFGKPLK